MHAKGRKSFWGPEYPIFILERPGSLALSGRSAGRSGMTHTGPDEFMLSDSDGVDIPVAARDHAVYAQHHPVPASGQNRPGDVHLHDLAPREALVTLNQQAFMIHGHRDCVAALAGMQAVMQPQRHIARVANLSNAAP